MFVSDYLHFQRKFGELEKILSISVLVVDVTLVG